MYISNVHTDLGDMVVHGQLLCCLRIIIIDFSSIISNAFRLKFTSYNINRDYPQEIAKARKGLWNNVQTFA